jgi:hypothetical protein
LLAAFSRPYYFVLVRRAFSILQAIVRTSARGKIGQISRRKAINVSEIHAGAWLVVSDDGKLNSMRSLKPRRPEALLIKFLGHSLGLWINRIIVLADLSGQFFKPSLAVK